MKRRRQQSGELTVLLRFMLLLIVSRQALSQITSAGSDQARALLDFKDANGNNSRTLESWVNGTDFCTNWTGVTCYSNFERPYVQAVRLPDAGLVGELSRSLGRLTSLSWLELSGNSITGPVPAQLSALRGLKRFKLDNNLLGGSRGGSIPQWLGKMSNLQEVSMANNQIQGEIPSGVFTNMSSLRTLVFSNNSLTGPIPSDLDARFNSSLQIVLLSEKRLTGSITKSIASSQSLRVVNISKNSFTGELPEVWNTPLLTSLDCSSNNLGGNISESLFVVPNLHYLNLANNSFIGKVTRDVSCRFGESSFWGNVQLIVEPCTSGSSPTYPPVPAPNSGDPLLITSPSPSPSPSSADRRNVVPLVITIVSSLGVAGAIIVTVIVYCALRRRHKAQVDQEMEVEKDLTHRDQFLLARAPGRDRIQAADARADGSMSGGFIIKDKSSGTYISCSSSQSESFETKETFKSDLIKSPTRPAIAHTKDESSSTYISCSRQSESFETKETFNSDFIESLTRTTISHTKDKSSGTYISSSGQSESFETKETFNSDLIESPTRYAIAHTKDKSSGTYISSSRQSESLEMMETFNSDLIQSPIAHSLELVAGRQGGRRGFMDRPSASSTEFSDEYTARCYTATMYTDLLGKVMSLQDNSLRRDYSLRSQHSLQRSTFRHGDLEQATS